MSAFCSCIRNAATCSFTVLTGIIAASAGALSAAIYSQLVLGLDPCVLCLYQRVPYLAAIILALIALAARQNQRLVKIMVALCAIAFLVNSGIAAYHSGVERNLWVSAVEGCSVPSFNNDPNLLEKILTTPAASCKDIAWADPFLHLTMANYNVLFSLLLFIGCVLSLALKPRPSLSEAP